MYRDPSELIIDIRGQLAGTAGGIVGLDGPTAVGKSRLASAVALDLNAEVIEVDRFHRRNGYPYVDNLRHEELRTKILTLRGSGTTIIVDAICLLDVLQKIGLSPAVLVYLHPRDLSMESDFLDEEIPLETIFGTTGSTGAAQLDEEIARYTRRQRPHRIAGFHFQWPEYNDGG